MVLFIIASTKDGECLRLQCLPSPASLFPDDVPGEPGEEALEDGYGEVGPGELDSQKVFVSAIISGSVITNEEKTLFGYKMRTNIL